MSRSGSFRRKKLLDQDGLIQGKREWSIFYEFVKVLYLYLNLLKQYDGDITHQPLWEESVGFGTLFPVLAKIYLLTVTWWTMIDIIKCKHLPRNWPFVRGIHRSRWIPLTKASDAELYMCSLGLHINLAIQEIKSKIRLEWVHYLYVTRADASSHDDVIKWKHFPRYWPFVREIHRSPVNSPHKGQWRGALMFSLICVWLNGWVNSREAGDLRRHRGHYDVNVIHLRY